MKEWFSNLIEKAAEVPFWMWAIVVAISILGGLVLYLRGKKFTARTIAIGALSVALAFILSSLTLFKMPQGGSLTPASMFPILAYAWAFGPAPGIVAGIVYGCMQLFQNPQIVHPVQFALDYILPFAFLGFAGFFKKNLTIAILIGCFARFLSHYISGIVFWGMYAPEGQPVWIYSMLYNGSYMLPETILCVIVSFIPQIKKLVNNMKMQTVKS
jgi:thiamine transporter